MNKRQKLKKGIISRIFIGERKKRKLETKLIKIPIYEDERGKFMHYCNFAFHMGAMYKEKVDKINKDDINLEYSCKKCTHYLKVYLFK